MQTISQEYQACIDACYDCAAACDSCASACLTEQDVKKMALCIQLDRYCAEICRAAATFMAMANSLFGQNYVKQICGLCADICDACAAECEKHEHQHCKECAQACRRCAEECRKMAA